MITRGEWSIEFARALGQNNPSASTINWISAWTAKEGTRAAYNPLATTYDLPPNTKFNAVGVRNYTNRAQGIEATVRTLRGNHPGYSDIIEGIVTNNPQKSADGLKRAPWGTNGTAVEVLWRNADVRDQNLLTEPETQTVESHVQKDTIDHRDTQYTPERDNAAPTRRDEQITSSDTTFSLGGGGGGSWYDLPDASDTQRYASIIGGGLLVFLAVILAIKTYVPTQQIVRTVAEVAATA